MLLLDHVVFLVKDLEKSIQEFEQMGYTVSKGGKHDNGTTENALIHFENGTFLELLAIRKSWKNSFIKWLLKVASLPANFQSPVKDFQSRFVGRAWICKEGITDFCLKASEGMADYTNIKNRNLEMSAPIEMKRVRPDGQMLSWHIFSPYQAELPFVMTPYQPAFKPNAESLTHPNKATGFGGITVYTNDFGNLIEKYTLLLGTTPIQKDENNAIFELGNGQIELMNTPQRLHGGVGFLEVPSLLLPKTLGMVIE